MIINNIEEKKLINGKKTNANEKILKIRNRNWKNTFRRWWWLAGIMAAVFITLGIVSFIVSRPATEEPPEAAIILAAQKNLNFGILIPAYMPSGFNRKNVELKITQNGQSGQPTVELMYRYLRKKAAIHIGEWIPANPELETLFGSRPIQTRWGTGYLLTQTTSLSTIWVDIGPMRVSVSSANLNIVSREKLVKIAETMGLASNLQVYHFYNEPVVIKGVEPAPPFIVKLNDQGVQELNLTITPGGYSPMRFSVKKGIPVRINFRALGEVGCGNALIFPDDPKNPTALILKSPTDVKVLEYTPQTPGDFQFQCTNNCYRGVVTVRE